MKIFDENPRTRHYRQYPASTVPKVFFERFEELAATFGTFFAITNKVYYL